MKSAGIITIHKINNYGSVLQAYALQEVCRQMGYNVEIIDYTFPNTYHSTKAKELDIEEVSQQSAEPKWIKVLFAKALLRQHKTIAKFVGERLNLSAKSFNSPEELEKSCPAYDVYITGSDQLWSPRYCKGDPAFMLHFAPDSAKKISYAASIGTNAIPENLAKQYKKLLGRYQCLSVRDNSGREIVRRLTGKDVSVVLDPTLLLNRNEWASIIPKGIKSVKKKYILCYFLNYTFDAFPYVDDLAKDIQRQTGYEIVRVARPPHHISVVKTKYRVGASPEEFLDLIRGAEIILTTSFHGTAFALNFGRPVFSVVQSRDSKDSRQANILRLLDLDQNISSISDSFPDYRLASYDIEKEQQALELLRKESIEYLRHSFN